MDALGPTVCDPPYGIQAPPLARVWPAPIAQFARNSRQPKPLCCRLDGLPLEAGLVARLVLTPGEEQFWRSMRAVAKRRHEWLLGRAVAKDAVRMLVEEYAGVRLSPLDIEIQPDPYGRPRAVGSWTARLGVQPALSISHSQGTAVALATLGRGPLVGIDLENLDQRRENFEAIAFSPDERDRLAALPQPSRQEWALRLWCAKEGVAKALGRGFSAGIQAFHITAAETGSGAVQLELREQALDLFPHLRLIPIMAYTGREQDLVYSTTIHPQGAVE